MLSINIVYFISYKWYHTIITAKILLNLPIFLAFPKVLRTRYWLNQIMVIYFLRENITVWLTFCFASIVLNQTSKYVVNFNVAMRL